MNNFTITIPVLPTLPGSHPPSVGCHHKCKATEDVPQSPKRARKNFPLARNSVVHNPRTPKHAPKAPMLPQDPMSPSKYQNQTTEFMSAPILSPFDLYLLMCATTVHHNQPNTHRNVPVATQVTKWRCCICHSEEIKEVPVEENT